MKMLVITENTRVAVVDSDGKVRGDIPGEDLLLDDATLQHELRGFGHGALSLWQLAEWAGMTDAQIYHLPRSVPDLIAEGAVLRRSITVP